MRLKARRRILRIVKVRRHLSYVLMIGEALKTCIIDGA